MAKSPSIRDVAQRAKVSTGTASRALNNKSNVLPETRARVLRAASELGYKLQFRVSSSLSTKLNTIGAVMKRDPGQQPHVDPFNYMILTGVEAECQKLGVNLIYSSIGVDYYSHATDKPLILGDDAVDGLLIIGAILSDAEIAASIPGDIPVVLIDAYSKFEDYDSIVVDNHGGAYKAVSHLISKGHRHIGLIASDGTADEHPGVRMRREAYKEALADHGIERTFIQDSYLRYESGYEAARKLIDKSPEVTAIFACNDEAASGAITALNEMGLSVPDDISVMGFDDIETATRIIPKLTTMFVDRFLMGVLGMRHLYDRAVDLDRTPIQTMVRTRLVERDSVKSIDSNEG